MKKITLMIFALLISAIGFAQTFPGTGGTVPDANCPTTTIYDAAVTGVGTLTAGTLELREIAVDISHTWVSDLEVTLQAPDGTTTLLLFDGVGGAGVDFTGTIISDDGSDFASGSAPFSGDFAAQGGSLTTTFDGLSADGTWSLLACDSASGDEGMINSWSLTFGAPPSCPSPTALTTTNFTASSVDIGWTDTAGAWEYVVQNSGGGEPTGPGNVTNMNPTTVGGLSTGVAYEFYVRSNCGGDLSPWAGPFAFALPPANDECLNATTLLCGTPLTGQTTVGATGGSATSCVGSIGNDVWYQLSGADEDVELTINASVEEAQVGIYESSDGTCAGFTLGTCHASGGGSENPVVVTFAANAGSEYFIRVGNWINGDPAVTFDISAVCTAFPTCTPPTTLTATNILETSADLGWTEAGGALAWEYVVQAPGSGEPAGAGTATATNPVNAMGLTGDTAYEFYVRADCSGDLSPWVGPFEFATPYVAVPADCTTGIFLDSGGNGGDYGSSESITTTICPDAPGDAVTVDFSFFSSEDSTSGCWDGLTIHDGPDATAPTIDPPGGGTIWCWDRDDPVPGGTGDLQGMAITSQSASGCLTFVFTSDGTVQREGWAASISCNPLSIDDSEFVGFKYFPNPTTGTLSLRAQDNIQAVSVYNMVGQEVLRANPNALQDELDLSGLQTGAYFIKVKINDVEGNFRIIRE